MLTLLAWPAIVFAVLATSYTGFLFAQGLGARSLAGAARGDRPHRAVGRGGIRVAARSPRCSCAGAETAIRAVPRLDARGIAAAAPPDSALRERAVAEPDAAPRARGRTRFAAAPTRRSSGASPSPAAACCRSPRSSAPGRRPRGRHARAPRCWRWPAAPRGSTSGWRRDRAFRSVKAEGKWQKAEGRTA